MKIYIINWFDKKDTVSETGKPEFISTLGSAFESLEEAEVCAKEVEIELNFTATYCIQAVYVQCSVKNN